MSQRALGTDSPARHASRLAAAHSGSAGPPVGGGAVGPCLTGQHLALSWPGRWPPPEPQTKLGPLRGPSWPCAPAPPPPPELPLLGKGPASSCCRSRGRNGAAAADSPWPRGPSAQRCCPGLQEAKAQRWCGVT